MENVNNWILGQRMNKTIVVIITCRSDYRFVLWLFPNQLEKRSFPNKLDTHVRPLDKQTEPKSLKL